MFDTHHWHNFSPPLIFIFNNGIISITTTYPSSYNIIYNHVHTYSIYKPLQTLFPFFPLYIQCWRIISTILCSTVRTSGSCISWMWCSQSWYGMVSCYTNVGGSVRCFVFSFVLYVVCIFDEIFVSS